MITQEWKVFETDSFDLDYIAGALRQPENGMHTEVIDDEYVRLVTVSDERIEELNVLATWEEVI